MASSHMLVDRVINHSHLKAFLKGICFVIVEINHTFAEFVEDLLHRKFLSKHMLIHTIDKALYSCDTCGKWFAWKGDYKNHVAIHNGDTPYNCGTRGKLFAYKSSLNRHMRIHDGVHQH